MKHIKTYEIFGFKKKKFDLKQIEDIENLKNKILQSQTIIMNDVYNVITDFKGHINIFNMKFFLKPILENKTIDVYENNEKIYSNFYVDSVDALEELGPNVLLHNGKKNTVEPNFYLDIISPNYIRLHKNHIIKILKPFEVSANKYNL